MMELERWISAVMAEVELREEEEKWEREENLAEWRFGVRINESEDE